MKIIPQGSQEVRADGIDRLHGPAGDLESVAAANIRTFPIPKKTGDDVEIPQLQIQSRPVSQGMIILVAVGVPHAVGIHDKTDRLAHDGLIGQDVIGPQTPLVVFLRIVLRTIISNTYKIMKPDRHRSVQLRAHRRRFNRGA